jgi:hypothetical protein
VAALSAVACRSEGEPLTVDEYRAQADEICRASAEALDRIPDPQGLSDIAPAFSQASPILEQLADDLDDLNAPEQSAERHQDVIDLLREQIEISSDAVGRMEGSEPVGAIIEEISPRLQQIEREANEAAAGLGLTVCGRGT